MPFIKESNNPMFGTVHDQFKSKWIKGFDEIDTLNFMTPSFFMWVKEIPVSLTHKYKSLEPTTIDKTMSFLIFFSFR